MNTIAWRADYMALFGQIHRARKAQKMTQAQAAAIIGMTERSYRDIENGHKDIGAENLFRLCAALGIRVFDPQPENRKVSSGAETAKRVADIRHQVLGIPEPTVHANPYAPQVRGADERRRHGTEAKR